MDITDNPNHYFTERAYKPKLICCACRKVFKRRLATDLNIDKAEDWNNMTCPNCGKEASYIGPKFRAPKADNIKAWKSIEVLNEIGVLTFMGFGATRTKIPESTKELKDMLTEMKADYEDTITRYVSYEYREGNKMQIKAFSDLIKRINKHLHK